MQRLYWGLPLSLTPTLAPSQLQWTREGLLLP